jgi:acyl-CoA synthetase (AMP-forming)/AMP-acid ligase II/acyl carrier protein
VVQEVDRPRSQCGPSKLSAHRYALGAPSSPKGPFSKPENLKIMSSPGHINAAGPRANGFDCSPRNEGFEPTTLVELLRWRSACTPDKIAYTFLADGLSREQTATYGDLDKRARAIASWLASIGGARQRVLLLYPSGLEFLAAFFGCLYAGAVAVPAHLPRPNRPFDRIKAIINDSAPAIILTTSSMASSLERLLGERTGETPLGVHASDVIPDALSDSWQRPAISGATIAFLQYTSGSTAMPKGVIVSHHNLLENERTIRQAFKQDEHSIIVGWLPLFHDMGLIGQVLQPLYAGAKCILMSPSTFLQRPSTWLETISRYQATTSGGPNFAYELCVRKVTRETIEMLDLSSWSVAFNGSEPIQKGTLDLFSAAFEPAGFRREAFFPCYGLAEATLFVTGGMNKDGPPNQRVSRTSLEEGMVVPASCESEDTRILVSCGRGASDQRVIIVDPSSKTRRSNTQVGEIWISGSNVAQGYWNRDTESRLVFQARLADTGEGPFLRTGDLGFVIDGQLYVTGRLKDLIIIRGRNHYSEDLEQTVQGSHEALRSGGCATFCVEVADEERLVVVQEVRPGYRQRQEVIGAIRRSIAEAHEIEPYAVILSPPGSLPRTSSGKLRRRACRDEFLARTLRTIESDVIDNSLRVEEPAPMDAIVRREDLAGVSQSERLTAFSKGLQSHVANVLGRKGYQVPLDQPLIRLGLDSLKAVDLQNRLESSLKISFPMATLLDDISIADLAALIDRTASPRPMDERTGQITSATVASRIPLSPGQHRLWFLDQVEPGDASHNISAQFRLIGVANIVAMANSIREIVRRHQILRTAFGAIDGDPIQIVGTSIEPDLLIADFSSIGQARRMFEASSLIEKEAGRVFDLTQSPLFRIGLLRLDEREHLLFFTVHHIVFDGWSLGVLLRELEVFYEAAVAGRMSPLSELPTQYADFALWQRKLVGGQAVQEQLCYWKKKFGDPASRDLPTDWPRPIKRTNRGAMCRFDVSSESTKLLEAQAIEAGSTLFMTLVAAYAALIHCITGQEDLVIGTPIASRNKTEFEKLIGFLVNTLVLRADLSGNPTFRGALARMKRVVLEAYTNQDVPFERVVAAVVAERELSRSPLYQVWFVLHQAPIPNVELTDLIMLPLESEVRTTKFDLALNMVRTPNGLSGGFEFSVDLFEATTVASFAADFKTVLSYAGEEPDISLRQLRQAVSRRRLARDSNDRETNLRGKLKTVKRQRLALEQY